jgi:hypothetical protein
MLMKISRVIGIPSLVLAAAAVPLAAYACITCSVTVTCGARGCHTTVTCVYQPGQCPQ